MPKSEWGVKRVCLSCAMRFYDLMQAPPTCPKCGAVIEVEAVNKIRKAKSRIAPKAAKAIDVETVDDDDDSEDVLVDDDDSEGVLVDDDDVSQFAAGAPGKE